MTDPLAPADPLAGADSLAGTFTPQPRPTGAQQWQSAIGAQQQSEMRKPSAADQVGWAFQQLRNFIKGGASQVMRGQGVRLPGWSNRISDVAQSEGFNIALGMASPAGMALAGKYAPALAGKIRPERTPSALERDLTFGLTGKKASPERQETQEWLKATRAEKEGREREQARVMSLSPEDARKTPAWFEFLEQRRLEGKPPLPGEEETRKTPEWREWLARRGGR